MFFCLKIMYIGTATVIQFLGLILSLVWLRNTCTVYMGEKYYSISDLKKKMP